MSSASHSIFDYNMGMYDIILRYMLMIAFGIIGGLTGQLWLMLFAVPMCLVAVLGWSPLYAIIGRDTSDKG